MCEKHTAATAVAPASATPDDPLLTHVPSSAIELHREILKTRALGHRCHHKTILLLLRMEETRGYKALGRTTFRQYLRVDLKYKRNEVTEYDRVARCLPEIPRTVEAFDVGEISWSCLLEISRVATKKTEAKWLEFTASHTWEQIQREVQHAVNQGRDSPREDTYGLPQVLTRMIFDLTLAEQEIVDRAFRKLALEMDLWFKGKPIERSKILVFLAEMLLLTEPSGLPKGRREADHRLFQILYALCPKCLSAYLHTKDGPVAVPAEQVFAIEEDAEKVTLKPEELVVRGEAVSKEEEPEIDRPNTPSIVRKVLMRHGNRCGIPGCGCELGLHVHHLRFRSRGGRTQVFNLIAVCARHHAAVHAGLLEVFLDPSGNVICRAAADAVRKDVVEEERRKLAEEPVVVAVESGPPAVPATLAAEAGAPAPAEREAVPAAGEGVSGNPAPAPLPPAGATAGASGNPAKAPSPLASPAPDPRRLFAALLGEEFLEDLVEAVARFRKSSRALAERRIERAMEKAARLEGRPGVDLELALMRQAYGLPFEVVPGRKRPGPAGGGPPPASGNPARRADGA